MEHLTCLCRRCRRAQPGVDSRGRGARPGWRMGWRKTWNAATGAAAAATAAAAGAAAAAEGATGAAQQLRRTVCVQPCRGFGNCGGCEMLWG